MPIPVTNPDRKTLIAKLARQAFGSLLVVPMALFIPAATVKFWQGWAFIITGLVLPFCVMFYLYYRDPDVLARRLIRRENIGAQRFMMQLAVMLYFLILILAGWDFQFGWTRQWIAPVPWWLTAVALAIIVVYEAWFVAVLKANRFAASIIHVETGQIIAASGPYRIVRHPMYLGMIVRWLVTAPALGSLVVWPVSCLIVPIFVLRLLNEEKFLQR
ncbi:MAG TPA: isoprenylcysteine carboxylmethyltransferase family protein, partial [Verrucomicrobiae bacterium]